MRKLLAVLCLTILGSSISYAGDAYPSKPITMVLPGPAGGAIDNVARVIAQEMSTKLHEKIVILNLGGAGGTLATARVAHAPADGYTILFHHMGLAIAPAIYATLPFDTAKDLAPIGLATEVPMVVVTRNDFPPKNVKELLAYLKAQDGKITLATSGPASPSDLCGTLLARQLGNKFTLIAYRGSPPALIDMAGSRIDMICDQTSTSAGQITAKTVKAYGVASKDRLPILASVPTLTESGFPFEFSIWQGLYAPAGTPSEDVKKLSSALQSVVQMDSVKHRLAAYGVSTVAPDRATPESHSAFLQQEMKRWAEIYSDTPKK